MTPAATATLMICYGSSSGRRSGRGSSRSRVECACGFSRAPQATQLGMAPPPVIKLVAGGTEAAANVNPQRDRMLTLGPTRVPPATWRFSGPPRPGKRRWNRPLAHVHPLRDNCPYRACQDICRRLSMSGATRNTRSPTAPSRAPAELPPPPGQAIIALTHPGGPVKRSMCLYSLLRNTSLTTPR